MSQTPSPGDSPRLSSSRRPLTRRRSGLIAVGLLLFVAIAGVSWRLLRYIEQELAPQVAKELSKTLNRPVQIGEVQAYSLTHIQFGASSIPACTPAQSGCANADSDSATIKAVQIHFNLWSILWSRTLNLDVTLDQPQITLDQTQNGQWLATRLRSEPSDSWIKVKLHKLRWQQGVAQLDPWGSPSRRLTRLKGTLTLAHPQILDFNSEAQVDSGGQIAAQGQWQASQRTLVVNAQTQDLRAAPLMGFLPELPFQIDQGQLNGQFQVKFQPQKPLAIHADTTLNQGNIWIPDQAIRIQADTIQGDVQLQAQPRHPVELKGQASLEGAIADVPEDLILDNQRQQPRRLSRLQGTVDFLGIRQRFRFNLKGQLEPGSRLQARGMASFLERQANLRLQLQNLSAPLFNRAFGLPVAVDAGQVSARVNVRLRRQQRPHVQGTALLKTVNMKVDNVPQPFRQVNGYLRFRGIAVRLEGLQGNYGQIPMQATGWIDPDRGYSLAGKTAWVQAQPLLATLQVTELPFPVTGKVKGEDLRIQGALNQPILSGNVIVAGQPTLDRVPFKQLSARFQLADALLQMTDIQAQPTVGGLFRGKARFQVQPGGALMTRLQAVDIPGNAIARFYNADPGFSLGPIQGQIQLWGPPTAVRTQVDFQAQRGEFPTTGTVFVERSIAQLRNIITQIPGGELQTQGRIQDNRVRVTTTTPGLALRAYSPDTRGRLTGQLQINGPLDAFSVATARAKGHLRFSDGIALVQDPITAQIRWDGQQIVVNRATAPGFLAQGEVGLEVDTPKGPQLTTLNLELQAQGYDLRSLPPLGPTQVAMAGQANLVGHLTGTVTNPYLQSTLQVNNLSVGGVPFEPVLQGLFRYGQDARLALQLSGARDRIHLALDTNQLPTFFDIRRDQAWAQGKTQQGQLNVAFANFPLAALNWQPVTDFGKLSGLTAGQFSLNPHTYRGTGNLAISQPSIGSFVGNRFAGTFELANNAILLKQGELVDRNNAYQIQAKVIPGRNPQYSGAIQIQQAEIADILAAANALNLSRREPKPQPKGSTADVQTLPIGIAQEPLLLKLRRLAELDQLQRQQQIQASPAPILPDWTALSGQLAGQLQFSGSGQTGLNTTFALTTQPLKWGTYTVDRVVAQGQFANGNLTLRPFVVTSGSQAIRFQGRIGRQEQSGQLTLTNVSLAPLNQRFKLPFNVAGILNGRATLAGTLANPRLQGELAWTEAMLNNIALHQGRTTFAYDQGRLMFQGGSEAIPLQFAGSLPYQLPLTTVKSNSDALQVSLKVKDQGLSLINLFSSNQLNWVGGRGEIDLDVTGTLARPTLQGQIQFHQATLASELLLEPLTQVTGTLEFDRDRIHINSLTGLYSQGQLEAVGSLPLFTPDPQPSSSLKVALKGLQLNVKDLYKGQIDGDLRVTGALLAPQLGGVMELTNGQVVLADVDVKPPATTSPGQGELNTPLQFNNLQVQFNENVRVTQPPLLNFVAAGNVTVNGSVNTPRPQGIIRFRQGSVNLFTSRFRIDSRRDNFAEFDPRVGLDPYLSIGMVTTATDIAGGRATELNEFKDLPAGRVGAVESIRVRAAVEGRASELVNNFNQVVQLTSTPSRSKGEILSLLGGNVPDSLEEGNTELALVNLASSAFLTGFEGLFADALGTRVSFRVFPVLIPSADQNESVLAFGAELGYDVTDRFSVSALQILTGLDEATLFNASYDINEQIRVRSAISTDGEAVGILEYRLRF